MFGRLSIGIPWQMDDLHLANFKKHDLATNSSYCLGLNCFHLSKITISRSWSPAKSSMPVGVIDKDTVLFAVPKKGRTSCGET